MLALRHLTNPMLQTVSKVVLLVTKVDCLDTKVAMVAQALLTTATTLDIKVEGQATREATPLLLSKVATSPLTRAATRRAITKVAAILITKVAALAMAVYEGRDGPGRNYQ